MATIQNPYLNAGFSDLAKALTGAPTDRAKVVALMAGAQNDVAQRDLRRQEQDYRQGIVGALSAAGDPNYRGALAYGSALDMANIAKNTGAVMAVPELQDRHSPGQRSIYQTSYKDYGDTEVGFGEGLANELAKAHIAAQAQRDVASIAAGAKGGASKKGEALDFDEQIALAGSVKGAYPLFPELSDAELDDEGNAYLRNAIVSRANDYIAAGVDRALAQSYATQEVLGATEMSGGFLGFGQSPEIDASALRQIGQGSAPAAGAPQVPSRRNGRQPVQGRTSGGVNYRVVE